MKWLNRKESWMRKKQRKKFVCTDGREKSINEVDIWWLNISGRTSPEETKENMCKRWWGGRQRKRKEGDYINFVVVSGARCQQSEFSWYEQFGHHNTIATSICEIRRNSASWKCIGRREGPLVLYCWPFDPEELSDCSIFPSRYQFFYVRSCSATAVRFDNRPCSWVFRSLWLCNPVECRCLDHYVHVINQYAVATASLA